MQAALVILGVLLAASAPSQPIDISSEPHHKLLLENDKVRVFRLNLQPKDATELHWHAGYYAYISFKPAEISNEVPGHPAVRTKLAENELHTSKGTFSLVERNTSANPAEMLVVEPLNLDVGRFASPMGDFERHEALFGELFEAHVMRGYSMVLAPGGGIAEHTEKYDRLLIATSSLDLREDSEPARAMHLRTGAIKWLPKGPQRAMSNLGENRASFIVLEFR